MSIERILRWAQGRGLVSIYNLPGRAMRFRNGVHWIRFRPLGWRGLWWCQLPLWYTRCAERGVPLEDPGPAGSDGRRTRGGSRCRVFQRGNLRVALLGPIEEG